MKYLFWTGFFSFPALQAIPACFCVFERNAKWLMIFSEAQRESDALYLSSTHLRCYQCYAAPVFMATSG